MERTAPQRVGPRRSHVQKAQVEPQAAAAGEVRRQTADRDSREQAQRTCVGHYSTCADRAGVPVAKTPEAHDASLPFWARMPFAVMDFWMSRTAREGSKS